MINILIPMAGEGSRFAAAGYEKPKPFIDVNNRTMIEMVMENISYPGAKYFLLARKSHLESEKELVEELLSRGDVTFVAIDKLTEGTACTVLFARKFINNDIPLLIANSDQLIDASMADFIDDAIERNLAGSILTFQDDAMDPKWSFAKIGSGGLVTEVKEKQPISNIATVGIYYFSKGRYFVDAAIDMIVNNDRVNNEFYTCPVYNYMVSEGLEVGVYNIDFQQMHGLGTPADLDAYLELTAKKSG